MKTKIAITFILITFLAKSAYQEFSSKEIARLCFITDSYELEILGSKTVDNKEVYLLEYHLEYADEKNYKISECSHEKVSFKEDCKILNKEESLNYINPVCL